MRCPHCGHDQHKVIDTRDAGDSIRRRRECRNCCQRFTSYEHVAASLLVIKRDGRREPFDRQLLADIRIAAVKRPISSDTIDGVVQHVEDQLHALGRAEVKSNLIGGLVLDELANIDQVAYIRFASVYLDFNDLTEIRSEVDRLMGRQGAIAPA
ncbi:MAG: transcriptional regulator NrdR [Caldilineaceae bacterium]|nr:transcriptional regulator NrdR [Caldilineaceae bacterium]